MFSIYEAFWLDLLAKIMDLIIYFAGQDLRVKYYCQLLKLFSEQKADCTRG